MAKRAAIIFFSAMACACGTKPAGAGTALLFDATNSHVLYAEEIDTPWYPASLTKLMTAYLAFSAMRDGRATRKTKVFISRDAFTQPPSRLGLKLGRYLTLDDALQALIIRSANDVAVAIAQTLSSDVSGFVKDMNQTAAELGMAHTHFINPNGLPAEQQVTTARDMALLTSALLRDFPDHASMFAEKQATIQKIPIKTYNALLLSLPGADGMKTGYTCASGYNIVASATREGHRIIAVVMGEPSKPARNARAAALIEHGFRIYGWKSVFPTARLDNYPRNTYRRRL